jgi:fermentation-respiration switch protein FrsA (DUF1100 family)
LLGGLPPPLSEFSSPDYAACPGLDAAKVQAALDADEAQFKSLGDDAQRYLTDGGATAEAVASDRLKQTRLSVHEMSSEAKWRETTVSGC